MSPTPDEQFIGKWRLVERGMFDGIEVQIAKDNEGNFEGIITKLNDDKYVKMFMEVGDKFVSGIKRNSNFEFTLKEKRIASPLFSAYGESTTNEFKVTIDGSNKILLGENGISGTYERVLE
jgi:RNase P/RNase MRP subunit p29